MNPRPEYKAKVIDDAGLTRGKVPSPLLRQMGARPGDAIIFRVSNSGKVTLHVSHPKKTARGNKRR